MKTYNLIKEDKRLEAGSIIWVSELLPTGAMQLCEVDKDLGPKLSVLAVGGDRSCFFVDRKRCYSPINYVK